LSPLPGFRAWLDKRLAEEGDALVTPAERKLLDALPGATPDRTLAGLLARPLWYEDETIANALKGPLLRLAAHYLLNEKTSRGRALDGVAHFHLSNGARLERINWLGDTSSAGIARSGSLTANYLYRLSDVERNHRVYTRDRRVVASRQVHLTALGSLAIAS